VGEVTMPRLSDTMQEGTIGSWLKHPGDDVKRGDVLAQIETDKATMDLTAFESGTLQDILVQEGSTVPIGQPVAVIGQGGATAPPAPPPVAEPDAAQAGPPADQTGQPAPPEVPKATPAAPEGQAPAPPPPTPAGDGTGKVRASPVARHIAAEHGIDLVSLHGSGPLGRIIRADVEAALSSTSPGDTDGQPATPTADVRSQPATAAALEPDDERVPLSQMRRTIARRMVESATSIPHFYLTATVDATDLLVLRAQLNQQAEAAGEGLKTSINDFIVRAAATALRQVPDVNVSFAEDSVVRHGRVHIGIAVATDRGLLVPVIRDADKKSVGQIARESRELAGKARDGKLQPADYSGGTFTVSNLGMFGVEHFTAVINPPEAAILAVGGVARQPAEHRGEIALRDRLTVTVSIDHRALDGATGARFLQALTRLLEQPLLILL